MIRRVQSVGMIILLLSAQPLHAAGRGQVVRLRVAVRNASDGQIERSAPRPGVPGRMHASSPAAGRGGWRSSRPRAMSPRSLRRSAPPPEPRADIELPRGGERHELLAVTTRSNVSQLRPQPTGHSKAVIPDAPARKPALTAGLAADRAEPPARTHAPARPGDPGTAA